jgi:hypothetical protein
LEGVILADYKVYSLDSGGRIASARWIVADGDMMAEANVRSKPATHDRELWIGSRKIARVAGTAPDGASEFGDSGSSSTSFPASHLR